MKPMVEYRRKPPPQTKPFARWAKLALAWATVAVGAVGVIAGKPTFALIAFAAAAALLRLERLEARSKELEARLETISRDLHGARQLLQRARQGGGSEGTHELESSEAAGVRVGDRAVLQPAGNEPGVRLRAATDDGLDIGERRQVRA